MTTNQPVQPTSAKPLRLWPGVTAAALLLLVRFVLPVIAPDALLVGVLGAQVCALAVVAWWMFFSRAPWSERLGITVLMIAALAATPRLLDVSIATGMMGMMFPLYAFPITSVALVLGAVASRRLSSGARRASMAAAILIACGAWTLLRTTGVVGGGAELAWRWTATAEERLLAQTERDTTLQPLAPAAAETTKAPPAAKSDDEPAEAPATPLAAKTAAPLSPAVEQVMWPGFRGPARDGVVRGARIQTDWATSPPVEVWRRPIGPGWSSFAVRGDLLYTQEQRGEDEIVACYKLSTGEPVWRHRDAVRFWESNGGAGPRGTPTLDKRRVYAFGATGILNALDAGNGTRAWSRNAASDTDTPVPVWGFASSPLVVDDMVIVAAAGTLAAYDVDTGKPRWFGPSHGVGYSSPHQATIDGVAQVLLLSGFGTTSVAPANGALLWEHRWPGAAIAQPALTEGDVLVNTIASTGGLGIRRLAAARGPEGWTVQERWTSVGLKPYFNDFVIHKGHAYGFDGSILACIGLEDGARKWKGGRYGNGQLVLLPDQDLLLVLSEDGELALVSATPGQFAEVARVAALDAKTWNHPVLVNNVLLVRNGEEMAAFRLSPASR